jgi:hypothetical protein
MNSVLDIIEAYKRGRIDAIAGSDEGNPWRASSKKGIAWQKGFDDMEAELEEEDAND